MNETAAYADDYRPSTYWDPSLTLIANIKGDVRQAQVINYGHEGRLEELPSWFFAESLDDHRLEELAERRPAWRGGEDLPDHVEEEVEIARITLRPGKRQVAAIRARPVDGHIAYRLVSEWEPFDDGDLAVSEQPLTPRELIEHLQSIMYLGEPLIQGWWKHVGTAEGVVAAVASLKVSSVFYPGLIDWYQDTASKFAVSVITCHTPEDLEMSLFGGPGTPARPLSPLHVASICGDADRVRNLLAEGEDPEEPVDPAIPVVMAYAPSFGCNQPLVQRIYRKVGYEMRLIEPGMTARDLAMAGGREGVVHELDRAASAP